MFDTFQDEYMEELRTVEQVLPPTAENELRWAFSYDTCGNLKTYADWEYEWEAGRQLVKQTLMLSDRFAWIRDKVQ